MSVQELVKLGLISRSCSTCPEHSDEVIHASQSHLEKLLRYLYPDEKRPEKITKTVVDGVELNLTESQAELLYKKRLETTFERYYDSLKRDAQQWVSSVEKIGQDPSWRDYVWIKKGKYTGFNQEKYEGNIYGVTELEAEVKKRILHNGTKKHGELRFPIRYRYKLPTVPVLAGLILLYGGVSIGEESLHRHAHS